MIQFDSFRNTVQYDLWEINCPVPFNSIEVVETEKLTSISEREILVKAYAENNMVGILRFLPSKISEGELYLVSRIW